MSSKYYGVFDDKVYYTWEQCKKIVHKTKNARFKSFGTYEDADYFVTYGKIPPPKEEREEKCIKIYTDGSCLGLEFAGVGVHFPDHDTWDISESFIFDNPTNQRAEIYAITRAIQILFQHHVAFDQQVIIYTDSKYCEQAYNSWIKRWEKNGWKTVNGQDVKNQGLFKEFWRLTNFYSKLKIEHVRAHCGIEGNERADKLAVQGSNIDKKEKSLFI